MNIAAIVLVSALTTPAPYQFQGVPWGTRFETIRKQFPKGHAEQEQDGETLYCTVQEIALHKNALVAFRFRPGLGLQSVSVTFPKVGTQVDVKRGGYVGETPEEGKTTYGAILKELLLKYGFPQSSVNDGKGNLWVGSDGSMFLNLISNQNGTATVGLLFDSPAEDNRPSGL